MNVDVRRGKPLTPGLQGVLNRPDRHTSLAFRQKESRVVISPRGKILGIKNQGRFIHEECAYLFTLAKYLAAALDTLLAILDYRCDGDGITFQLPHFRNSQTRCQEKSEQSSVA